MSDQKTLDDWILRGLILGFGSFGAEIINYLDSFLGEMYVVEMYCTN